MQNKTLILFLLIIIFFFFTINYSYFFFATLFIFIVFFIFTIINYGITQKNVSNLSITKLFGLVFKKGTKESIESSYNKNKKIIKCHQLR